MSFKKKGGNYPDSVNPGDPDAPWNLPDEEWGWFVSEATIIIYAQGEDHARELLFDLNKIGTPRFKEGQEKPFVEVDFDRIKKESE